MPTGAPILRWMIVAVAGKVRSGVVVATMIRSMSEASRPAAARARRAASAPRSDAAWLATAWRRERMPVRSTIQASLVSTNLARSSLVTISGGR